MAIKALGKEYTEADLSKLGEVELVAIMDDLNAQREAIRAQGRLVNSTLAAKLGQEAVLAKLAGLDPSELSGVLALAAKDPAALAAAIAKSRAARPVLEVTANAAATDLTVSKA